MRALAVSVLVDLKDRFSRGLGGLRRKLAGLSRFGQRLGLDRVGKSLANIGKQATLMAGVATAAFAAATTGVWAMARGVAEAGDAAFKAGQRTGVHVETLQELAYAAELSDLPIDSLQRGIGRLADMAGKGDKMFKDLGIQLKDGNGNLRDTGDLLKDMADIFTVLPDGTEKTALATRVFGDRLGRELIPFLNEGRAGLERLGKEARDLGIVLPEEFAAASVSWNDNIARFEKVFEGLKTEIIGPLIPLFDELTVKVRDFIAANKAEIVEKVSGAIKSVIDFLPDLISGLQTAGDILGTMFSAGGKVVDMLGGFETIGIALAGLLSGKLLVAIGAFGAALLTTPVGWFLLAVTGIAFAAKLIYDNWDDIADWFSDLWDSVVSAAETAWDTIKTILSYHPLALIINNWSEITDWFSNLWDGITDKASSAWETIKDILSYHPLALIVSNWTEIVDWFNGLGDQISSALSSTVDAMTAAGSDLMQALWDGLKAKFDEVIAWVATIPDRIMAYIEGINPMDSLRSQLPSWAGGFSDEELAQRSKALERVAAGAQSGPQGGPAASGPLATQAKEAKVGGQIVVKVEGPGSVAGVRNANKDVPIVPDRGASLVSP